MTIRLARQPSRALMAAGALLGMVCGSACSWPPWYPSGVLVEKVRFEKTEFFRGPGMNLVSDLREGDFDGDGAVEIAAVAEDGAHLLAPDGREKRFVPFQAPERPFAVRLVPGAGDGRPRYVGTLPVSGKTVLFDATGAIAWRGPGRYFGEPVAADMNGDGTPEVVVSTGNGLEVLALDGASIGRVEAAGTPLHFDCADVDGDGRADVVTEDWVDGRNRMAVVFSGEGRSPARWPSPRVFNRFTFARRTGDAQPSVLVLSDSPAELVFLDGAGGIVRRLEAPGANYLSRPHGMPMRVAGSDKGFVCLGDTTGSRHHHIAYVYNAADQLVYADSADQNAGAVLAMSGGGGTGAFLVGSRNVIWKYAEAR